MTFFHTPIHEVFQVRIYPSDGVGGETILRGQTCQLVDDFGQEGCADLFKCLLPQERRYPFDQQRPVPNGLLMVTRFEMSQIGIKHRPDTFGIRCAAAQNPNEGLIVELLGKGISDVFIRRTGAPPNIAFRVWHFDPTEPGGLFVI